MSRVLQMNIGRACRINNPKNELQEDIHRIKSVRSELDGTHNYILESIETRYKPHTPTVILTSEVTLLSN